MRGTVDAVLLASGAGIRFGENKLLVPFRGIPLARRVLDLAVRLASPGGAYFNQVFFIAACPEVAALVKAEDNVTVINNQRPFLGQRESIRLGAEYSGADYSMFIPCDQGMLDEETIALLFDRREPGKICRPEYNSRPGAPVLFSARFRGELAALNEGESGKEVIRRHSEALIRVAVPRAEPLIDFDTRPVFDFWANIAD